MKLNQHIFRDSLLEVLGESNDCSSCLGSPNLAKWPDSSDSYAPSDARIAKPLGAKRAKSKKKDKFVIQRRNRPV